MTTTEPGSEGRREAVPQGNALRFNVLGSLESWAAGGRLKLGGAIQERVLSMLLLESGRVVNVARLVEAAWEQDPPATAAHQVRKAVADLRRRIPDGSEVIVTDGPGYRAAVTAGQLDLLEFDASVQAAGQAAKDGRLTTAAERLASALALWRGPVLSGAGGPVIDGVATALEERRLSAAEQYFGLRLTLGESGELVPGLRALIGEHPLRETLRGQLMLALYRTGRQAEALQEYGRVRELLVEELGIDPGPQLARLYEAILRDGPELAVPEPPAPDPVPEPAAAPVPVPVPAQPQEEAPPAPATEAPCTLPYDLPDFTGRAEELNELFSFVQAGVEGGPGQERYSRIVAIDGMGGTGKTSLAVRAAHRLAARYPDGQLLIDLRGFTPGETPVNPASALDGLLRTLGTPGDRIPEDLEGRTTLWRSVLDGRRVLLLLDNAADAAQIRPLLPASPGCLVLVTSRARLMDLDGVEWVSVDLMKPGESADLMTQTLGAARVAAEPEAAAELAELCGHLPLALRIATARLRNRPRWTVRYLVERLRDETRRMDELSSGERSVAATLRLSYLAMDEKHRTAFRILSLHPGADVDVHTAAALLGTTVRDADDTLEFLLDVHLVQQPEIGLYTFHDLVRSFAQSLRVPATEAADAAAVERLLGYYLTATDTACEVLFPGRKHRPTGISPYEGELPPLGRADLAGRWFDQEHDGLMAAVTLADQRGHDRYTACLSRNLAFHLHARGRFDEFWSLGRISVAAARRLDDPHLLSVSLANLGAACWKLGRFEEGLEVATEGRDTAVRLGDRHIEAHSESTIGLLLSTLGQYTAAFPLIERAIGMAAELGARREESEGLTMLSTLHANCGRFTEAEETARLALGISRSLGYQGGEVTALTDLAFAQAGRGEYGEASTSLRTARGLCDWGGERADGALLLALSAEVADRLGEEAEAAAFSERALALARASGAPIRLVKVENLLGRRLVRRGEYEAARTLLAHAHRIAAGMRLRPEEADALVGLARVSEALGEPAAAARQWAEAEEIFAFMGVPGLCRAR
ncbi:BTAD domain-containing putative transcriptional regulator [Streptomyces sp. NPDC006662]|uniref:AfsR/SARP family transcriptional regulator n=1 Tax=Streptomyces sp. NPDC006662 TaxID=3156902 RepID=UPI0033E85497